MLKKKKKKQCIGKQRKYFLCFSLLPAVVEPRGGLCELNPDPLHKIWWGLLGKGWAGCNSLPSEGYPGGAEQRAEHTSSEQTHSRPLRRAGRVGISLKGNSCMNHSFSNPMKMSRHDPKTAGRINYLPNVFHMLWELNPQVSAAQYTSRKLIFISDKNWFYFLGIEHLTPGGQTFQDIPSAFQRHNFCNCPAPALP